MTIHTSTRTFDRNNIKPYIRQYRAAIRTVGDSIAGLRGIRLLHALKRTQLDFGIYTDVTLFEAANRIMSDLVILQGVKFLLENRAAFPFDSYTVELGNEDRNDFDIRASADDPHRGTRIQATQGLTPVVSSAAPFLPGGSRPL